MKLEKVNAMAKKMVYGMATALPVAAARIRVSAQVDTSEFDWIKGEGNGTFDGLTETVKQTGASIYQLMMAFGVVGLVVIAVYCGIKIAAAGPGRRADALAQVLWLLIGGTIVFGSLALVGFMKGIAGGL